MTQDDIRAHYQQNWKGVLDGAKDAADLSYSSPIEDAVLYPAYEELIRDLAIDTSSVLDVGCGSGRWVRFFTERFRPRRLLGVDFAASSVDLLRKWHEAAGDEAESEAGPRLEFRRADIADPTLDLGERFSLINIANVLFHIPEHDRFAAALFNLARHVAPGGRIVTTEYLPRFSMRTEWMLVRSRYEFEALAKAAGLRIVAVRPFCFFSNDPMGVDGPDASRAHFNAVRARLKMLLDSGLNPDARRFIVDLFAEVERAAVAYCRERIAEVDLPSQKLVVLARDESAPPPHLVEPKRA
jgi:SAM-dependent methyltransferase